MTDDARPGSGDACRGCTGACCRDVVVGIGGRDAWRIARANALPFASFVSVASAEAGSPGAFRLAAEEYGALVLARSAADTRSCAFLVTFADGQRRCGTHPSRPRVCRSYPMARDGASLVMRAGVACGPDDWDLARVTRARWFADLDAEAADWRVYERVVAAWNLAGCDGFPEYLAYVRAMYDALETEGALDDPASDSCERIAHVVLDARTTSAGSRAEGER